MKAYELLDSPEKWTKGGLAKDAEGHDVMEWDKAATCFCAMGAIFRCYEGSSAFEAESKLCATIGTDRLAQWNDAPERTFEEVRSALIKADV